MKSNATWRAIWCPTCGREAYAREWDFTTRYAGGYYAEIAPHWDWQNRLCQRVNKWMSKGVHELRVRDA